MGTHRYGLKTLRDIALAHTLEPHPDLASLARELGSVIHRDARVLDENLAELRQPRRGLDRWLLARRTNPAVSVLLMAWPANHATPSHDHAGLWGLELSLHGALEVESWTRPSSATGWQLRGRDWIGPGDAVWFDADTQHMHRCRNLSRHETAFTLHVYGGDLDRYAAYEPSASHERWRITPQRTALAGHLRV